MASERVEAVEAMAAWVRVAAAAVPRTKAASGQSPEGIRKVWVEAPMGVVKDVSAGVSGMGTTLMGTTEAETMG